MLSMSTKQSSDGSLRTYFRNQAVVFFKTNDQYGGLSNMASGYPLQVNGLYIPTTEALYQSCRFPHFPKIQQEIIAQHSPMTAKMKSKTNRKYSRKDWEIVRNKIMRWCLRVKLAQNYEKFGKLLISTGDFPIVEQSRKDSYWGAKLTDETGQKLVGQNVLGRLLMELREKFKNDMNKELKKVIPIDISNFLLLGRPIEIILPDDAKSTQRIQQSLF